MAFAASNPRRQLVIHWEDYDRTLPTDSSSQSKLRRRELFDEIDPAGNGILQQAAVVRALFRLFPCVAGISDTRPLLNLCFRVARDTSPPIVPIGVASVDRNEFRGFLICLRSYLRLWEVWYNHTSGAQGPHDLLIRPADADLFRRLFKEWKCADVNSLLLRLQSDVTRLDASKIGAVEFDKFADAALRRTLPFLIQEEEGAEVGDAKRLLKATHEHLFFKEGAPAGPRFSGGVTLALGKGPKKYGGSSGSIPFDGSVTCYVKGKNKGWSADAHSQYVHDFAVPQYAALKQAAKSRLPLGRSESQPSLGLSAAGGLIASTPSGKVTFKLGTAF